MSQSHVLSGLVAKRAELGGMACCRFRGHRVKVLKMEPEFSHGEKKVQPRVQA